MVDQMADVLIFASKFKQKESGTPLLQAKYRCGI